MKYDHRGTSVPRVSIYIVASLVNALAAVNAYERGDTMPLLAFSAAAILWLLGAWVWDSLEQHSPEMY